MFLAYTLFLMEYIPDYWYVSEMNFKQVMEIQDNKNFDDTWWIVYKAYILIALFSQMLLALAIVKVKSSKDIL